MRGNPQFVLIAVVIVFLLMGVAVWKVTHAEAWTEAPSVASTSSSDSVAKPQTFELTANFTHPPLEFAVEHLGKTIMSGKGPGLIFKSRMDLALPQQGIELVLRVRWPDRTSETAVRLRCETGGAIISDRTFWGNKELAEVILVR